MGLAAATLLLVTGGGVITGLLAGSAKGSLVLRWIDDPNRRLIVGSLESLRGNVGLLGLGPLTVTATALLLSWRDRLVLTLAMGGAIFMLASLVLHYNESPDLLRLDGHARNFGMLALLIALATRLSVLRAHWRYLSALLIVGLVAWPTLVAPMRNIRHGLDHGIHLSNAQPVPQENQQRIPKNGALFAQALCHQVRNRFPT